MPAPNITVEQSTDAGETLLSVMRDDVQVIGVVAAADGAVTVGYWDPDGLWVLLHTVPPK